MSDGWIGLALGVLLGIHAGVLFSNSGHCMAARKQLEIGITKRDNR